MANVSGVFREARCAPTGVSPLRIDTEGTLRQALFLSPHRLTLVDVLVAPLPCPPRLADAARDDVTAEVAHTTGARMCAVLSVGPRRAGLARKQT